MKSPEGTLVAHDEVDIELELHMGQKWLTKNKHVDKNMSELK